MAGGPMRPLRVTATHHGDDGVGIAIKLFGEQVGFVHIPPLRGRQQENADLVCRKMHDLNGKLQRAIERWSSRGPTMSMPEDEQTAARSRGANDE